MCLPWLRLLGEPCDPAILIQHYGKLSSAVHTEAEMDLKSESAAIYVLVGRSLDQHCWILLLNHQKVATCFTYNFQFWNNEFSIEIAKLQNYQLFSGWLKIIY